MAIFALIGCIGLILLVAALIFGEIFDGLLDIDAIAWLDSDIFSTAGIAGLLGGFGFAGMIGLAFTSSVFFSTIFALVIGCLLAISASKFIARIKSQVTDPTPSIHQIYGYEGIVITDIPEGGYGQIRVLIAGHRTMLNAQSNSAIEAGRTIWVDEVISPTCVRVTPYPPLRDSYQADLP